MIRLIIQEMEDTLVEVRSASAKILADKKTQERQLRSLQGQAVTWEEKAKLALSKDREDLARAALNEKRRVEADAVALEGELMLADEHIQQLHDEVGQLQAKLDDAKAKRKRFCCEQIRSHSAVELSTRFTATILTKLSSVSSDLSDASMV